MNGIPQYIGSENLLINVGCGRRVLDGWVNVDVQAAKQAPRPPEVLADARNIPLPDGCALTVMALHVIEHFYLWEVGDVLAEWRRLLKPGGRLVLELPDLAKACRNYLQMSKRGQVSKLDQYAMWPLYGDPSHGDPYMCHRWGYDPNSIATLLSAHGYADITHHKPQTHGARVNRDMRIEAVKL